VRGVAVLCVGVLVVCLCVSVDDGGRGEHGNTRTGRHVPSSRGGILCVAGEREKEGRGWGPHSPLVARSAALVSTLPLKPHHERPLRLHRLPVRRPAHHLHLHLCAHAGARHAGRADRVRWRRAVARFFHDAHASPVLRSRSLSLAHTLPFNSSNRFRGLFWKAARIGELCVGVCVRVAARERLRRLLSFPRIPTFDLPPSLPLTHNRRAPQPLGRPGLLRHGRQDPVWVTDVSTREPARLQFRWRWGVAGGACKRRDWA